MNELERRRLFVWWTLWGAFMVCPFFYYSFLGGARPAPESDAGSNAWLASLLPLAVSAIIRWVVLTRTNKFQAAFAVAILGIGFAESVCLFGLFLFPGHKFLLMVLSVLGIAQFAPVYASRLLS
jgi:hypothetical protein